MRRRDALAGLGATAALAPRTARADAGPRGPSPGPGADRRLDDLDAWAAAHAVRVSTLDAEDPGVRALAGRMLAAPVMAFGEPAHGVVEPLALRNALIAAMLRRGVLTGVALETGAHEARALDAYVGGVGDDAQAAARAGFNWGFGELPHNVQLLRLLRAHNAAHRAQVRVFGADVSGGDSAGAMSAVARPLEGLCAFLSHRAEPAEADLAGRLAPFVAAFSQEGYARLPAQAQRGLAEVLAEAERALRPADGVGRPDDPRTRAWRDAVGSRQLLAMFAAWPPPRPGEPLSPDFYRVANARDAAIAQNTLWAARVQPAGGRLLLYAHAGHVMATPTTGGPWAVYRGAQHPAGERLRRTLGRRLLIVAGLDGAAGNALSCAASPPSPAAWLDLRPAPPGVAARLAQAQPVRVNGAIAAKARLRPGADLAVVFPALTRSPR